jgi:laminin alpha 3/5
MARYTWCLLLAKQLQLLQIYFQSMKDRPTRFNFSHSELLQNFSRATNIRIRLLATKTLQGHLMELHHRNDPTITRRVYLG